MMNLLERLFGKKDNNPFKENKDFKVELFEDAEAQMLLDIMDESDTTFVRMKNCTFSKETKRKLKERGYTAKNIMYQGRPGTLLMR